MCVMNGTPESRVCNSGSAPCSACAPRAAVTEPFASAESLAFAVLDSAKIRGKNIEQLARKIVSETEAFSRLVAWKGKSAKPSGLGVLAEGQSLIEADSADADVALEKAAMIMLDISANSLTAGRRGYDNRIKEAYFFFYLNKLIIQEIKATMQSTSNAISGSS